MTDVEVLHRAYALFAGTPGRPTVDTAASPMERTRSTGAMAGAYRSAAADGLAELRAARRVDTALTRIVADAYRDHLNARQGTGAVLAAARSDTAMPDNPIAARELVRRRLIRLRTQHTHVRAARHHAQQRQVALRQLRYRTHHPARGDGVAANAVRAALSRIGRPYVWGATGPDRFDCSGLVQWAYAQAGLRLRRTTYEQIHDGAPIPRSQVRPGDLVFPHPGHVQMAIGNGLVVEAPQPGATVQISRLGDSVAIRRPG